MSKPICLLAMPFTPITSPGLGVSILQSAVRSVGVRCDIFYGTLEFLRTMSEEYPPDVALFDYNFIASNQGLGDLLFSPQLWRTSPDAVLAALDALAQHRNVMFTPRELSSIVHRVRRYFDRSSDVLNSCLRARQWDGYSIVAFSSTFSQNVCSLVFARMLAETFPDLHIVFGGANADGDMGRQLLQSFPWVDAVIQGEAEHSFPQYVLRHIESRDISAVPGVLFRQAGEVVAGRPPEPVQDLDATPLPDFDDYFHQLPPALLVPELRREISLPIETSRGCWWGAVHHCIFCGLNPATMAFRAKSPARAIAEFRRVRQQYGERKVTAVDNILSMRYFQEVLPSLEDQDLDIFYETKSNLSEAQVRQLSRAGVRSIQPGIEGLSSEILGLMKKGVQGYKNLELLKWCSIYQIAPIWFYLYRFPGEPVEPYWSDIARIPRLSHLPPPRNPNPVVVDRYSPLYVESAAYGLRNLRPAGYAPLYYHGLTPQERLNICYHFEADLPQGAALPYEVPLWQSIMSWNRAYAAGARLHLFTSSNSTLIVDTRRDRVRAFLLSGAAHRIHQALRTAQKSSALWDRLGLGSLAAETSPDDLELTCIASILGAEWVASPESPEDVATFLQFLDQEWLAEHIDGRWIALAVDCSDIEAANRLGLSAFTRFTPMEETLETPQLPSPLVAIRAAVSRTDEP